MEYTLSCAAIARGFSAYLATLAGQRPTFFTVHASFLHMDFFALGLIIVLSCILAYGTKVRACKTYLSIYQTLDSSRGLTFRCPSNRVHPCHSVEKTWFNLSSCGDQLRSCSIIVL